MAYRDKACSYLKAAIAKRSRPQQNLTDRELPGDTFASHPAADILHGLLRSVTFCHVLLRSPRSTSTQ